MSIRLDADKCRISDPENLKIKRYLSDTRSYLQEGMWIRDHFSRFFPAIKVDEQGLYYDLTSLEPACNVVKGGDLNATKLPQDLVDQFQGSVQLFRTELKNKRLSFNEEVASAEFTLPDPNEHPELYWLMETNEGYRLVILWGLASEKKFSNISPEETGNLLELNNTGKVSSRQMLEPTPLQQGPIVEEVPSPAVEPIPQQEEATVLSENAPEEDVVVVPLEPERVPDPVPEIKKADQKDAPSPVSVERRKPKDVKTNRFSGRTKRNIFRIVGGCVGLVLLVYLVAGLSHLYLGESVVMQAKADAPNGISFRLPSEQDALLPGGLRVSAEAIDRSISVSSLPKAGNYEVKLLKPQSDDVLDTLEFQHRCVRNDFEDVPIASLLLDSPQVKPGEPVFVHVGNSFHETEKEPMELKVSWGEEDSKFFPVELSESHLSHVYAQPGLYKICLLAKDSSGNWDYDSVDLMVAETNASEGGDKKNFAPIINAEIASVQSKEGVQEVTLDVSNCFDPDGTIHHLEIDWNDGSEKQSIGFPIPYVTHQFKGCTHASIQVNAVDQQGLTNPKVAIFYVDFQSNLFDADGSYGALTDGTRLSRVHVSDSDRDLGELRLVRKEFDQVFRNKQHLSFELHHAPVSGSQKNHGCLVDVEWTLTGPNDFRSTVEGVTSIDSYLVDGVYQLSVTAKTLDGEVLETEQRVSVYVSKKMQVLPKVASWLKQHLLFSA